MVLKVKWDRLRVWVNQSTLVTFGNSNSNSNFVSWVLSLRFIKPFSKYFMTLRPLPTHITIINITEYVSQLFFCRFQVVIAMPTPCMDGHCRRISYWTSQKGGIHPKLARVLIYKSLHYLWRINPCSWPSMLSICKNLSHFSWPGWSCDNLVWRNC